MDWVGDLVDHQYDQNQVTILTLNMASWPGDMSHCDQDLSDCDQDLSDCDQELYIAEV